MITIDLSKPTPGYTVSVTPEESAGERRVRLFKDVVLFVLAVVFVVIITWVCVSTLGSHAATEEEKKWAMSILTAAAGGMVGYLIRK